MRLYVYVLLSKHLTLDWQFLPAYPMVWFGQKDAQQLDHASCPYGFWSVMNKDMNKERERERNTDINKKNRKWCDKMHFLLHYDPSCASAKLVVRVVVWLVGWLVDWSVGLSVIISKNVPHFHATIGELDKYSQGVAKLISWVATRLLDQQGGSYDQL